MSLSYETHSFTGTPLLKADENLIETLEDNQVKSMKILIYCMSLMHIYILEFYVSMSCFQSV